MPAAARKPDAPGKPTAPPGKPTAVPTAPAAPTRRPTVPTASTWGKLRDAPAPSRVRFRFPWEETDTEATYVRPLRQAADREDADGNPVEVWVHVVDYGGEVGEQETMLVAPTPVELLDTTPAATATGTTTGGAK